MRRNETKLQNRIFAIEEELSNLKRSSATDNAIDVLGRFKQENGIKAIPRKKSG